MPATGVKNPRAATCEDVDEETQAVLSDSRTSANVARKRPQPDLNSRSATPKKSQNGSDSGYSSKAGTNESIKPDRKASAKLTADSSTMERTPQPYTFTPAKPKPSSQPALKVKPVKEKAAQPEEKYRHPQGTCMLCDRFGYHFSPPQRPATAMSAPEPQKAQAKSSKTKADDSARPKTRRQSSIRQERPTSAIFLPPQPNVYATPVFTDYVPSINYSYGPQTPLTPSMVANPYGYPYSTSSTGPSPYSEWPSCCDPHLNHHAAPQYLEPPSGMLITYGEQPPIHAGHARSYHELESGHSHGSRARPPSQKSSKSLEADARAMPPPPRPSLRRSSNEPGYLPGRRPSVHYEDHEKTTLVSKRISRDLSNYDPPPSAWKGAQAVETPDRPRSSRKSASYSDGSVQIATTNNHREHLARRSTDPLEDQTAQVEEYQARVSRGGSGVLTAEALKSAEKQRNLSSEFGSTRSVHSSSRESARAKRSSTVISGSGRTNITIDGGIQVSIPQDVADQEFNLQFGKLTLSLNKDKEGSMQVPKDATRLERASSNASRDSRRSMSGASMTEDSTLSREHSRRSAQIEPKKPSPNSSKRSSRAPSLSRSGQIRPSQNFGYQNPEDFYGA